MLKSIGLFFLIMIGMVTGLLVYNWQHPHLTPEADVTFTRVDRDTTFYIGRVARESSPGGHLSVWVTGKLDDSTAVVTVSYEAKVPPTYTIRLPAGSIQTVLSNDFYGERAKITYLHKGATTGNLRLRAIFGFPPTDWPVQ